jgi:hypothetical protein
MGTRGTLLLQHELIEHVNVLGTGRKAEDKMPIPVTHSGEANNDLYLYLSL